MFANRNYTKTENHLEEYRTERAEAAWERQQRNKNAGLHPSDPRYVNEDPLDGFRCNHCGKSHEFCRCGEEIQEKP